MFICIFTACFLKTIIKSEGISSFLTRNLLKFVNIIADNEDIVDFDFKVHHDIFIISKNAHLARLLERLLCHYLRFWLSIPRQIDHNSFFSEALELIKAIENKDEQKEFINR